MKSIESKPIVPQRPSLSSSPQILTPAPKPATKPGDEKALAKVISYTLMPAPKKPAPSTEQLKLQDQLIIACEQGDLKAVQALFKTTFFRKLTAKPDVANTAGKQPLGAAVWGMNPSVVDELLMQAGGVAGAIWNGTNVKDII